MKKTTLLKWVGYLTVLLVAIALLFERYGGVFDQTSPIIWGGGDVQIDNIANLPTVTEDKPLVLAPGSGFHEEGYTRRILVKPPKGKTCGLTYTGCVDVHAPLECTPARMKRVYCIGKPGQIVDVIKTMCGPSGVKLDGGIVYPHKDDNTHTHRLAYGRIVAKYSNRWISLEELNISRLTVVKIAINAWKVPHAAGLNTVSKEDPIEIKLNYCH